MRSQELVCAKLSWQGCAVHRASGPCGWKEQQQAGFGLGLLHVDVAKALVLLAHSHILQMRFAQVSGLTA